MSAAEKRDIDKLLADGGTLYLDEPNTRVGIAIATPLETLHVGGNLRVDGSVTFGSSINTTIQDFTGSDPYNFSINGEIRGDIIKIGNSTTVLSKLYYLTDSGAWALVDADASTTGGPSLLGLAVGTNSNTNGMLIRGFARVAASILASTATAKQGDPVYISTTDSGLMTFTAPSATNDIVRIVGYLVAPVSSNTDSVIYFRPDNTWVEIS